MIITSLLLTTISYFRTTKEIVSLSESFLMQVSTDTAKIVEKEIRSNAQLSEELANYIGLQKLTETDDIIRELKGRLEKSNFKNLGFADKNGDYIDTDYKTTNMADRSEFKMAIEGTRAASELYISKINGELEIAYCAPVEIDSEIIGVLVATKDGFEYSKIVNSIEIGHEGFAFILDRESGQMLAYPEEEPVKNLSTIEQFVSTDKKYESFGKATTEMRENIKGMSRYEINGEEKLILHTGILSDYWILGIVVSEDSLLTGTKEIRVFLMILTLILIIIATIIIIYISKDIGKSAERIKEYINEISLGNFKNDIDEDLKNRKDEFGEIAKDIEKINLNISEMVKKVKEMSENIDCSSIKINNLQENLNHNNENISSAINEVAQGNSLQTSNLSDITVKLESFNKLLNDTSECIDTISKVADKIDVNASESNNDMIIVTNSIKELTNKFDMFISMVNKMGTRFEGITNITALIQEISEKTNLLSLNAAIESARAGEAGKGFSVVAEEIRKLAMESSNSTKKINNEITGIIKEIELLNDQSELMGNYINGQVESINKAIVSFENISVSVKNIQPMIKDVEAKSEEINKEKKEILYAVDELLAVSEEVTASSEEITSSSEQVNLLSNEVTMLSGTLVEMTDSMKEELDNFKTK